MTRDIDRHSRLCDECDDSFGSVVAYLLEREAGLAGMKAALDQARHNCRQRHQMNGDVDHAHWCPNCGSLLEHAMPLSDCRFGNGVTDCWHCGTLAL